MKRVAIAIVLMLFAMAVAHAQTCTPVTLSQNPTQHDDGQGPNFYIVMDSATYPTYDTLNIPSTTQISFASSYGGYVDINGLYGGCLNGWHLTGFHYYYGLYDLTESKWVFQMPPQEPGEYLSCGKVVSCGFYNEGDYYVSAVTPGHSYRLFAYIQMATDLGSGSGGSSPWYHAYITINVQ